MISLDETLLRRFCPTNPNHVSVDEGTGEIRLKSGAIGLRDGEKGVSVYCTGALMHAGLSEGDISTEGYEGIAAAGVRAISMTTKLEARPDPWPTGEHPMPHIDFAHSLICPSQEMTKSGIKRQLSLAARQFAHVTVPDRDASLQAIKRAQS